MKGFLGLLMVGVCAGGAAVGGDGTVAEVVRMLEAEVSEEVVFSWLDQRSETVGELSADDVIALTQAGASRELIDRLMAPPPKRPASKSPVVEPGPLGGVVPVTVSVIYQPLRDDSLDDDEQWHLFVYLDSQPVGWVDGRNWLSKKKKTTEITRDLGPGTRHTIRLAEERHFARGKRWTHEVRVCPDAITFEAAPRRTLEIEITDPISLSFKPKRTYRWAVLDDGAQVAEKTLAGPTVAWPPLCEEIEANFDGRGLSRHARKQLETCAIWGELWPTGAPDRAAVRDELARRDYRPE